MSSDERMLQELMFEQTINEFNDTIKIFKNLHVDDEVSSFHNNFANIFFQKADMVIRGSNSVKEKTRQIDYLKNFLESKIREFHTWQRYKWSFPEEYISSFPKKKGGKPRRGGKSTRQRRGGKSRRKQTKRRL